MGVIAGMGSSVSGRLMPLWLPTLPPTATVASMRLSVTVSTVRRTLPSSMRRLAPGFSAAKISGWGIGRTCASVEVFVRSKTAFAPVFSSTAPLISPSRSFGPCKSTRMATGRPTWASTVRTALAAFCKPRWSVWLMLMRKTSAPASNRARILSGVLLAGPRVARILVLRARLKVYSLRGWGPRGGQSARFSVQSMESRVST